jgi:hypothetical protein
MASSVLKSRGIKALTLFFMLTLSIPALPVQASSEASTPAVASISKPGETIKNESKKKDLTGFFAIGAVINILFFGAFLVWARKESQKRKKAETDRQQ